jgi:hypothetical protein
VALEGERSCESFCGCGGMGWGADRRSRLSRIEVGGLGRGGKPVGVVLDWRG